MSKDKEGSNDMIGDLSRSIPQISEGDEVGIFPPVKENKPICGTSQRSAFHKWRGRRNAYLHSGVHFAR